MSEQLQTSSEKTSEKLDLSAESKRNLEAIHKKASQEKDHHVEAIKELGRAVENKAVSGTETPVGEQSETTNQATIIGQQKQAKQTAYKQTMSSVRRHLPKSERRFSKVIHQPAVQAISEFSSKTVARPSGFLAGGLAALVGSSLLLWTARHYGFTYNFTTFAVLFVAGYLVGVLAELLIRTFKRS